MLSSPRAFRSAGLLLLLMLSAVLWQAAVAQAGQAHLIVDARTGRVLAAENADVPNHPASLTKMMTLYMTFDALHRGKLSWNSQIPITKNAAGKIPTKLGVAAGKAVTVEEAVLGMIVLSANDAAAAMGDALGGSEPDFAGKMTKKARQLGMRRTIFRNASGLPHPEQVTTARDMAILAMALQRDFPREYRLFSTKAFVFRGRKIRGHNNLMYRYEGMDGIKTGYTNASGFNLVSSVTQGNRRLVGVVLGGRTARSRDDTMAALLDQFMPAAPLSETTKRKAGLQPAAVAGVTLGAIPVPLSARRKGAGVGTGGVAADALALPLDGLTTDSIGSTWQVQIAATESEEAAMALLAAARTRLGQAFGHMRPSTQALGQGSATLFRARFVNFEDRRAAEQACRALKQKAFSCLVVSGGR